MMEGLFVVIMPVGSEDEHQYGVIEDSIHQTMLFADMPTPSSLRLSFQRFGMSGACSGVLHKFMEHVCQFLKRFRFMMLQPLHVQHGFIGVVNFVHGVQRLFIKLSNSSAELMRCVFPCRYCSSPLSRLAKNSSLESNVGSDCISATSLRKYLVARFSRLSFSAMMLMLRSISAIISIAVITSVFYGAKVSISSERTNK